MRHSTVSPIRLFEAICDLERGMSITMVAKNHGITYGILQREWKKRQHGCSRRPSIDRIYSEEQVLEIRSLAMMGTPHEAIAFKFKCTTITVGNISRGITYGDIPGEVITDTPPYRKWIVDLSDARREIYVPNLIKRNINEVTLYVMAEMGWSRFIAKQCIESFKGELSIHNDEFIEHMLYKFTRAKRGRPSIPAN